MKIDGKVEQAIINHIAHLENEITEDEDAIITTMLSKTSSRQRRTSGIVVAVGRQIGWRRINRDQIIKRIHWLKNMGIIESNGRRNGEDMWHLSDTFKRSLLEVEE